ncbi:hypothetical protein [Paraburkholderia hospita]|uniref:hypothetical protein n=1 Tax=Paraburkholderia hospita TaxID=169430 RepID=UPI0008A77804|nr:hypothetical protein [Paraburkholderia hospita]SEH89469.1 hypothetical protein SAMN05192544_1011126 [Paraburkholderia hospita]
MLTNTERRALELARVRIEAKQHVHLCYALNTVSGIIDTPAMTGACNRLKCFIMRRLAPHATLDDWIGEHHPDRVPQYNDDRRQARIDWINWMLDETPARTPTVTVRAIPRIETLVSARRISVPVPRDRRPTFV